MNDQQRAAMQMALEALEEAVAGMGGSYATWSIAGKKAITSLREALAQPQGEPVAFDKPEIKHMALQADTYADAMDYGGKNYTGLRDEYFAELVIEATKEKAAKIAEQNESWEAVERVAAAIRSMK